MQGLNLWGWVQDGRAGHHKGSARLAKRGITGGLEEARGGRGFVLGGLWMTGPRLVVVRGGLRRQRGTGRLRRGGQLRPQQLLDDLVEAEFSLLEDTPITASALNRTRTRTRTGTGSLTMGT